MKPLKSLMKDEESLKEIGRASIQIVHDLKNQLNGLKLYATFLRKRMEKSERPPDELETIGKLIAGLERAAGDMTTLVRISRPVELRLQQADLTKILSGLSEGEGISLELEAGNLVGEFDLPTLSEALKTITLRALGLRAPENAHGINIHTGLDDNGEALIEWRGLKINNEDPFHSLAGSEGIRMTLAAKFIEAHGGQSGHNDNALWVRLPLEQQG
jgi:signal transduction histidine kinase